MTRIRHSVSGLVTAKDIFVVLAGVGALILSFVRLPQGWAMLIQS